LGSGKLSKVHDTHCRLQLVLFISIFKFAIGLEKRKREREKNIPALLDGTCRGQLSKSIHSYMRNDRNDH
jgi:hypothetical protein